MCEIVFSTAFYPLGRSVEHILVIERLLGSKCLSTKNKEQKKIMENLYFIRQLIGCMYAPHETNAERCIFIYINVYVTGKTLIFTIHFECLMELTALFAILFLYLFSFSSWM